MRAHPDHSRRVPRIFLAVASLIPLLAEAALARAGGGERWGGGNPPAGGGGGFGFLIEILLRLFIYNPSVTLLLILAAAAVWWYTVQQRGQIARNAAPPPEASYAAGPQAVAALRAVDARFSAALFTDFAQLLYARFHRGRGTQPDASTAGGVQALAPYFAPDILGMVEQDAIQRGVVCIDDVLVGSSRILGIDVGPEWIAIRVVFEGNFTEVTVQGPQDATYVAEEWRFERKRGVLSRGPEEITHFNCPSCGNPGAVRPDGSCPYCDRVVNRGDFSWVVTATRVLTRAPRPPLDLRGGWAVGTDYPTVYQMELEVAQQAFAARNPDFSWPAFESRVRAIFVALQAAWSERQWMKARPFETDALFNVHRYWMEMYQHQALVNRLENVMVGRVIPARFDQDAFFDVVTVRVWAAMRDYVVDRNGQVVGGDPRRPREFSEYWTFIRRTDSQRRPRTEENACPNCGAPLQVNMAGECEYCQTRVTSGQFDWVLSAIEQDEAYKG